MAAHQIVVSVLISSLFRTNKGIRYILSIQDQLTKLITSIALQDITTKKIDDNPMKEYLSIYVFREKLIGKGSENRTNTGYDL